MPTRTQAQSRAVAAALLDRDTHVISGTYTGTVPMWTWTYVQTQRHTWTCLYTHTESHRPRPTYKLGCPPVHGPAQARPHAWTASGQSHAQAWLSTSTWPFHRLQLTQTQHSPWPRLPHKCRYNRTWAHLQPKSTREGIAETRPHRTARRALALDTATCDVTQETAPHMDAAYAQTPT